jgi:hypothetical protein
MRFLVAMALSSALACASTSSASSAAQPAYARSCASPQVPAVVEHDTDVYASPDSTSLVVGTLANRAMVCADATSSGYGFRRVKLANGAQGYVDDANVSLL